MSSATAGCAPRRVTSDRTAASSAGARAAGRKTTGSARTAKAARTAPAWTSGERGAPRGAMRTDTGETWWEVLWVWAARPGCWRLEITLDDNSPPITTPQHCRLRAPQAGTADAGSRLSAGVVEGAVVPAGRAVKGASVAAGTTCPRTCSCRATRWPSTSSWHGTWTRPSTGSARCPTAVSTLPSQRRPFCGATATTAQSGAGRTATVSGGPVAGDDRLACLARPNIAVARRRACGRALLVRRVDAMRALGRRLCGPASQSARCSARHRRPRWHGRAVTSPGSSGVLEKRSETRPASQGLMTGRS